VSQNAGCRAPPPNRRRIHHPAIAKNGNNLAQHLIFVEGLVVVKKRITAGDEPVTDFTDEPVSNQSLVAVAKHDMARAQFRGALPANRQDVSGKNRG
jgi:hypothetical protein